MPSRTVGRRAVGQPGLGPYTGPAVVLALLALVLVAGLVISLVGAVRAPDDVSNSATILGTFPLDPEAPGILPPGSDSAPASPPGATSPSTPSESRPTSTGAPAGEAPEVIDAFDGTEVDLATSGGDWRIEDGALVGPDAEVDAPAFALVRDPSAPAEVGAEVARARAGMGVVVGHADDGTYVAALAVPEFGGWRLEVRSEGEVTAVESGPSATVAGTVVQLSLTDGRARLVVDGEQVAEADVGPAAVGAGVGFISRGGTGGGDAGRWAARVEGPPA